MFCSATLAATQDFAFMITIAWTAVNLLVSNYFLRFTDFNLYGLTFLRWGARGDCVVLCYTVTY
jgi:hypothetical protein